MALGECDVAAGLAAGSRPDGLLRQAFAKVASRANQGNKEARCDGDQKCSAVITGWVSVRLVLDVAAVDNGESCLEIARDAGRRAQSS